MKKLGFTLLVACIAIFSACSDSKKDDVLPPVDDNDYAAQIDGSYAGALSITLTEGEDPIKSTNNINLSRTADNKVKLALRDFSFGDLSVSDIVIEDVAVAKEGSVIVLKEKSVKLSLLIGGNPQDATVSVASGSVKGETLVLRLDITDVFDDAIVVTFDGEKDYAKEIEGSYGGNLKITIPQQEEEPAQTVESSDKIHLTRTAFNKVKLELKDFSLGELKVGDIILNDVPVTKATNDAIAIGEKTEKITLNIMGMEINATVSVKGGEVKDDKLALELAITDVFKDAIVVTFDGEMFSLLYDFEEWKTKGNSVKHEIPSVGTWACSNNGLAAIISQVNNIFPITKTTDTKSGNGFAARIETFKTEGIEAAMGIKLPFITAGSLFTGKFNLIAGVENPLLTSQFGEAYNGTKPLSLKFEYKYTPGEVFYRSSAEKGKHPFAEVEEGTTDACSVNAILYDITDNSDYITGVDTYKDERIVAEARYTSDEKLDNYVDRTIAFSPKNGKEFDANRKYRLAILTTSSAYGDTFSGAPGSVLFIDNIRVIAE